MFTGILNPVMSMVSVLLLFLGCRTPNETAHSIAKQNSTNRISLTQIERGESGYSPDSGLYYVWDNGNGHYHVEISENGEDGYFWIRNQKIKFDSGCTRGKTDIGCSSKSWIFFAPLREDTPHHIYGAAVMVEMPKPGS